MTVEAQSGQISYTGNGVAVFFEYNFTVLDDSVIVVLVETEVVSDYQVQTNGILFTTPPEVGDNILISRFTDITQLLDFYPFEAFHADKTEDGVDKLIILKQEGEYRLGMNLSVIRDDRSVTILNDKGTDAYTPLWNHTLDEAGMFAGVLTDQAPGDGGLDDNNSFVWFEKNAQLPPSEVPTSIVTSINPPLGQISTEMNFSNPGGLEPQARSNPFNAIQEDNFFFFVTWRWINADPGPVWQSSMLNVAMERRPFTSQFYMGYQLRDVNDVQIIQGTFEYGPINAVGLGLANYGDWITMACSIKNIQTADPNRLTAWFWNHTQQTEQDFSGDATSMGSGQFGMIHPSERGVNSRTGWLNLQDSNPYLGQLGFQHPIAAHGFDFIEVDLSQESERDKIATSNGLSDHGFAGELITGRQMPFYTQGAPQEQTGWMNIGDPVLNNDQYPYGVGLNRPPYNYAPYVHPLGDWIYPTMALADASGDAWQNGDTIYIDEGFAVLRYDSAMAVSGHSGLIHQFPFWDEPTIYSSIVVEDSEAEGSDPTTWNFNDTSCTGTEGVDWEIVLDSGLSHFRKLTNAGAISYQSNLVTGAGDEIRFGIVDRVLISNVDQVQGSGIVFYTGDGISNGTKVELQALHNNVVPSPPDSANVWSTRYGATEHANILVRYTPESRFWCYCKGDKVAIWTDIGPLYINEDPRSTGIAVLLMHIFAGAAGDTALVDLQMGRWLMGRLS